MTKLPSAEEHVDDWRDYILHAAGVDDLGKEMLPWVKRFKNEILEAAAEYFEAFPGALTGRQIAVDLRKRKEPL